MPLEMIVERVPLAVVDHLGAGIGLLVIVGHRDRIEFADRILAVQHAAGIFPGDRAAGLDLGPAAPCCACPGTARAW